MENKIYPCLWFDNQAAAAADLYTQVFEHSRILANNAFVYTLELAGSKFMCINGGPKYQPNPSISFFVVYESEAELDRAWKLLSENGKVVTPLGKYAWSEKYGTCVDQFGISWQLLMGKMAEMKQKITPALMFTGDQFGRAMEAMDHLINIFKSGETFGTQLYPETDELQKGKLRHGQYKLLDQMFIAMDSGYSHQFTFNEALSLVVDCDNQEEIDYFWEKLSEGGSEGKCGWLKDKFGISWQILPRELMDMMSDPARAAKVGPLMMEMKKFDIATLRNA